MQLVDEDVIRELVGDLDEVEVTKDAKVTGRYNLVVTDSYINLDLDSFVYYVGEREHKIIDFEFYGGQRKSLTVDCVAHAEEDEDNYNVYLFSNPDEVDDTPFAQILGVKSLPLVFKINEDGSEEQLLPTQPENADVYTNIVAAVSVLDYYSKNVLKEEDYQNAQTAEQDV